MKRAMSCWSSGSGRLFGTITFLYPAITLCTLIGQNFFKAYLVLVIFLIFSFF